jgi:hypothetical protein
MKRQIGSRKLKRNLIIKKNCSNFKMIMRKRTRKKKKSLVSLKLMENLVDVKTLKKKSLKDSLIAPNQFGSSTLVTNSRR